MIILETFRNIKGFEDLYKISNTGKVISLPRKKGIVFRTHSITLKQKTTRNGYKVVVLTKNNTTKHTSVHRLVADAFVHGKTSQKYCVNHKDGNKTNNNAKNLEWCTPKDNIIHAWRIGLINSNNIQGEKHGHAKITNVQAMEILKSNKTYTELSNIYKISKTSICNLRKQKTWKCLKNYDYQKNTRRDYKT